MRPGTRDSYLDAIQRVIVHVATHLDDAIDLEMLAADACLSPFHFHRVFRGMVGETPMEFVRRLRLERAAWQLAHGTAPVTASTSVRASEYTSVVPSTACPLACSGDA